MIVQLKSISQNTTGLLIALMRWFFLGIQEGGGLQL